MHEKMAQAGASLVCAIVDNGLGTRVLRAAKQYGATGGTVLLGKGTAQNHTLNLFGLGEIRKEIVYIAAQSAAALAIARGLHETFQFEKPGHGIVFSTALCAITGTENIHCDFERAERGEKAEMYHLITAIVDKGKGEDAVSAAIDAGAKGGTVLNARGAGIHETSRLFAMEIEPEKEMVLILAETGTSSVIAQSIGAALEMEKPGNGILYIQPVQEAFGIQK